MLSKILNHKTAIMNGLAVITAVVTALTNNDVIAQNPDVVVGLVSALGVLNMISNMFKTFTGASK